MGLDPYYSSSVPKTTVRGVSEGAILGVRWASLKVLGIPYTHTPTKSPWAAIDTKVVGVPRDSLKTFGQYLLAGPPTIHDQPTPA